ncbi:MAG: hypothetical protein JW774_02625 [Candidatus Aureabacteria bacterium]|nr:hypothetical protein [Candidatus Auribacterota bacterium]
MIYCIEDSFTYGLGLSPENSYPAVLKSLLDQHGLSNTNVINLGLPNTGASYALYAVAAAIKEGVRPSILIVLSGWNANNNDFLEYLNKKKYLLPFKKKIFTLLEQTRSYRLIHHLLTLKNREMELDGIRLTPLTADMSLYDFISYQEICLENLQKIVRISKEVGVPVIFMNYPCQNLPKNSYNLKQEYYHLMFGRTFLKDSDYIISSRKPDEMAINSVIRYVAEKESIPLIDLNEAFIKSQQVQLFQQDWHHPNILGTKIMAETIFDFLVSNGILKINTA